MFLKAISVNNEQILLVAKKTYHVLSASGRTIQGMFLTMENNELYFDCNIPGGKTQKQSVHLNQIKAIKVVG